MAYIRFKPLSTVFLFHARLDLKEDLPSDIEDLIPDNEKILVGAKSGKNLAIFTTKRLLLVDSAITTLGKDRLSIPYDSISTYCLRVHNTHSSLRFLMNNSYPIKLRFMKDYDNITIKEIYKVISEYKYK